MRCGGAGSHRIFEPCKAEDLLAAGLAGKVVDGVCFGEGHRWRATGIYRPASDETKWQAGSNMKYQEEAIQEITRRLVE